MSIFFNGKQLITPTLATRIDDTAMSPKSVASPLNLALVGVAESGRPQTVYDFTNPVEAREVLKGGELLIAIEKAFAPSAETGAPGRIKAIRVDPATQAFLVLAVDAVPVTGALQAVGADGDPVYAVKLAAADAAATDFYKGYRVLITSGPAAGLTNLVESFNATTKVAVCKYKWPVQAVATNTYSLVPAAFAVESDDWGLGANRIKMKIESGTTAGKKVTVALGSDSFYADNLAATYFTIQYTGAAASALLTISGTTITIAAGDLGSEAALHVCDLSIYDTVAKVVDFFDAKADMTAILTEKYRDYPVAAKMDYITGSACKAAPVNATANLQAVVEWLDGAAEPHVTTHRPAVAGALPVNVAYTFLHGGTKPSAEVVNWTDALTLLQTEDVQVVVPVTSNASIHASVLTHCIFMSTQTGKERRCIVGGALNEANSAVIARAEALRSDRCYLATPGYKDYDTAGILVTRPAYMTAALLGGMICGCDPGTSLTNKTVNIQGLEKKYAIPTDTDEFILNGIMALVSEPEGFKVAQSISTWLANGNYNRVEMATGFAVDYISRTISAVLKTVKGKGGRPGILAEAISRTENQLKELAKPAPLGMELIVGDAKSPPFKNITASLVGDVVRVQFECSPVVPVNFILVGISVTPYSGASAA